jgi:hypothetical protein
VHNEFAILSQPNAPTHYNALSPTQQIDNDKTIIPPGPQEHRRQQKIAQCQHIKQTLRQLGKSDDLFLDNSITPKPRMKAQPLPKTTPTMQSMRQLILPMHDATNQLSSLPNLGKIRPTAWIPHSIGPSKSLTRTNMSVCQAKKSTPIQCHFNP